MLSVHSHSTPHTSTPPFTPHPSHLTRLLRVTVPEQLTYVAITKVVGRTFRSSALKQFSSWWIPCDQNTPTSTFVHPLLRELFRMFRSHTLATLAWVFTSLHTYSTLTPSMFTLPLLPHTYPLSRVPFSNTFSTPPSSKHRIALLMCSCPWMDGARDRASTSNTSCKSRQQLHISFLLIYTHFNQTPVTLYPTPLSPPSPPPLTH